MQDVAWPFAVGPLGLLFRVGEGSSLLLRPTARLWFIPRLADEPTFITRDAVLVSFGLAFEFGQTTGPADRDGDGVPDAEDKCPDRGAGGRPRLPSFATSAPAPRRGPRPRS